MFIILCVVCFSIRTSNTIKATQTAGGKQQTSKPTHKQASKQHYAIIEMQTILHIIIQTTNDKYI